MQSEEDEYSPVQDDSDNDEYIAPSQAKQNGKKKKKAGGTYQVHHALKPPRATSYSTQTLFGMYVIERPAASALLIGAMNRADTRRRY
jgi:hypothetical protein